MTISAAELAAIKPLGGTEVPYWTPDGDDILVTSSLGGQLDLWLVPAVDGAPRRVTNGLGTVPFLSLRMPQVSPDGSYVSYVSDRTGSGEIWLRSLESGAEWHVTRLAAAIEAMSWSPDGRRIAVAARTRGVFDIYVVEVPGGRTTQLTTGEGYDVYPNFTPDGEHVIFVRLDETWTRHLVLEVPVIGGAERPVVSDEAMFDYHYGQTFGYPRVSPDGAALMFRSLRSGWFNEWVVPTDASAEPRQIAAEDADQTGGVWSPDSARIAYTSNHNGTVDLRIVDAAGGDPQVILEPGLGQVEHPQWSPGGDRISFLISTPTSPADLHVLELDSGAVRRRTHSVPVGVERHLAIPKKTSYASFDGREIPAYVYEPRSIGIAPNGAGVVLVHGGPTMQWFDRFEYQAQYLVQRGYTLVLPNVRGSSGYGREFEELNDGDWLGGDLQDVLHAGWYLETLDGVDEGRLAITGLSYGGIMTMAAVAFAPGVFRAGVSQSGYGDFVHMMEEQELRHRKLMEKELGRFEENAELYRDRSPIHAVHQATTPCFVLHGSGRHPQSQAGRRFALALEKEYKTFRYKAYPDENYYVLGERHIAEMLADIDDFFRVYLDLPGAPEIMPAGPETIPR